ncbi:hypothetical protein [Haloparvum sp. PAK95]
MQPPRLTSLLTWTVVGTYFLVALGAQLEYTARWRFPRCCSRRSCAA